MARREAAAQAEAAARGGQVSNFADKFHLSVDVPFAAARLAQAAGRLVRTATDGGVVMVLDPRIVDADGNPHKKGYSKTLRRALGPMPGYRTQRVAVEFIPATPRRVRGDGPRRPSADVAARLTSQKTKEHTHMTATRPDGLRALVVDDDPAICDLVGMVLSGEGWEVTTASDGNAALAAYDMVRPDLLVLDIMMPERDGLDVLGEIRYRSGGWGCGGADADRTHRLRHRSDVGAAWRGCVRDQAVRTRRSG
jgi:hypothetical protein